MHNSHTEKVGNLLTEISHKILCDIATHDRYYSAVTLFTKLAIAQACSLLYLPLPQFIILATSTGSMGKYIK